MKIETEYIKAVSNITGVENEIKVFKLDAPRYELAEDKHEAVYEMTRAGYRKWFKQYYDYEGDVLMCDLCGNDEFKNEKVYLLIHHVGKGWYEPSRAFCHDCWTGINKSHKMKKVA